MNQKYKEKMEPLKVKEKERYLRNGKKKQEIWEQQKKKADAANSLVLLGVHARLFEEGAKTEILGF